MCINKNHTLLVIDSSKRDNTSESTTDFQVNLRRPIPFKTIKLESIRIPLTWYNITSSNNSFTLDDGTEYNLTVTSGRYHTLNDLLDVMQDVIRTATSDSSFTVVQHSRTGRVTISATGNFTIEYSALMGLLGMPSGSPLSGASSYTLTRVPSFYSIDKYIMLKIDRLEGHIEHINNLQDASSFVVQLPNISHLIFGEDLVLDNNTDDQMIFEKGTQQLSSFRVQLYDSTNTLLDLNNNDMSIILRLISDV